MSEIDQVARQRAIKNQDAHAWTPKDCLLDAIEEIEKTEKANGCTITKAIVIYIEDYYKPDGTLDHSVVSRQRAGMTRVDEVAYCEVAKQLAIDGWRG